MSPAAPTRRQRCLIQDVTSRDFFDGLVPQTGNLTIGEFMAAKEEEWADEDSDEGMAMCHALSEPVRPTCRQASRGSTRPRPPEYMSETPKSDGAGMEASYRTTVTCPDLDMHQRTPKASAEESGLVPMPPSCTPPDMHIAAGVNRRHRKLLPVGIQSIRSKLGGSCKVQQLGADTTGDANDAQAEGELLRDPSLLAAEADADADLLS